MYMKLIELLSKIQQAEQFTDGEMAERLNISRVHWNNIKHGKARIGIPLLNNIKAIYPKLTEEVVFYLLTHYTVVNR